MNRTEHRNLGDDNIRLQPFLPTYGGEKPLMTSFGKIEPAVPVERSVFPDRIVCLECAMPFKMLKRHLQSEHGLNSDTYRRRYGLPPDYPLVAPDQSEARSSQAKNIALARSTTSALATRRRTRD